MNVVIGLLFAGGFLYVCCRVFRSFGPVGHSVADEDDPPWSMKRSDPLVPPEVAHKLPAHLLEGCPPDPCPEVLYEDLRALPALTYAELKRPKVEFSSDCCGSTRTNASGLLVCPECDHLDFPEET